MKQWHTARIEILVNSDHGRDVINGIVDDIRRKQREAQDESYVWLMSVGPVSEERAQDDILAMSEPDGAPF